MAYIPTALYQRVAKAAKYRCGYCQTQEFVIGGPLEIDHIIPESRGGPTEEDNLWLACWRCNRFKSQRTQVVDPNTGAVVPLFNPRHQVWHEHFHWQDAGLFVVGITPIGRATVDALRLNNPYLLVSRRVWIAAGWHPPSDE
jgi:hypothetical protein